MIDSKTIGRYFSVYVCIGVLYAMYSYCLDMIFHSIEYESKDPYFGSMGGYLLIYFVFFYISLTGAFFYNAVVNNLIYKNILRVSFGIILGGIVGYTCRVPSYYIGEERKLKTLIAVALTGLSVEIMRIIVVRRREQKRLKNEQAS